MKKILDICATLLGDLSAGLCIGIVVFLAVGAGVVVGICLSSCKAAFITMFVSMALIIGGVVVIQELCQGSWSTVAYEGEATLYVKGYKYNHPAPGFEAQVWVCVPALTLLRIPTVIRHGNAAYLAGLADSHCAWIVMRQSPSGRRWVSEIRLPQLGTIIRDGEAMENISPSESEGSWLD